jgi:UDP-2,4-diacetamido-2,4,6-trideoxy-beta-L-altropyranose hydrolase
MRVAFRADASIALGSGHLTRCRALADELRERGARVQFFTSDGEDSGPEYLRAAGFPVHLLKHTAVEQIDEMSAALATTAPWDWLLVDHYAIEAGAHRAWRAHAGRIAVIDDLADRELDCDLLLDQNYNALQPGRYDALVPRACMQILGPHYALLRPEFSQQKRVSNDRGDPVNRLLISLGGSDPDNIAAHILRSLSVDEFAQLEIDVLAGQANPHFDELLAVAGERPHTRVHRHVDDPWQAIARADLIIGAGGGSTWERCCLGVPSAVISLADNQRENARKLGEAGYTMYLGDASRLSPENIRNTIGCLIANPALRQHLSDMGQSLVDGKGARRVANILCAMNIQLRPAVEQDCLAVLEWRNAPGTRENSLAPDLIDESAHTAWFKQALEDDDRIILIAESEGRPVGVMRYDVSAASAAVSIYLVPGEQGKGFGQGILHAAEVWLRTNRPEVCSLTAEVLESNQASQQIFERAGFGLDSRSYLKSLETQAQLS